MPFAICGQLECLNTCQRTVNEKFVKRLEGRGAQMMYQCSQCMNVLENVLVCSRCKTAYYCSKACQTLHWRATHKKECVAKKK